MATSGKDIVITIESVMVVIVPSPYCTLMILVPVILFIIALKVKVLEVQVILGN